MKKRILMLLVLVSALSIMGCGNSSDDEKTNDTNNGTEDTGPIKIGVLDAFTGEKAANGEYSKEAADMFAEKINAEGGVLGRELQIIYEDDQGLETVATNAYQKIVSDHPDLSATVLSKLSSVVLAQEQFVAEAQIPAICHGSSVNIEALDNEYMYSTRKSDNGSSITIANAATDTLGMTKVAILHAPDALGTGMAPIIQEQLEKNGAEVVNVQQFSANEKNFAPYIAKLMDSGFVGVISMAQQREAALIMKAFSDAGIDLPVMGSSAFCQHIAIENAGPAANGWYSVTSFSPNIEIEPTASWIAEYEEKYGRLPDMASALTYDALGIFVDAIEKTGSANPEDINNAIKEMQDYQGVGAKYTYNGNPMLSTSEFLTHIEDEKSVVVELVSD